MGISGKLSLSRRKVAIAVVLGGLFVVGIFAWQATTASTALLDARKQADAVQSRIKAGDFDGANRALAQLRDRTRTAHGRTDGLLWDIGSRIPYLGRNIGAVQTVSAVLDTATRINAPIALELSQALDEGRFRPVKGQIDLTQVQRYTPDVRRAADSIAQAGRDLDEIRPSRLLFPFNDLVGNLQDQFDRARAASAATANAFDLLPGMLGQTEPRDYLLMIQNPAELRSTGGLPGSLSILHADHGRLTMGWQGSAGDLNPNASPVVRLPKDTEQQYGSTVATDFRDLNFTPDFPEAAQIAKAMFQRKLGVSLDGVVSVDPIALSYLIQGTGPVTVVPGLALRADSVAPTLLNQVYRSIQDPGGQNDFFAAAARNIFNAVMAGQGSQQQAVRGLATGAEEHRVLLWSARESEQSRLDGTAVSGALPGATGSTPQVGMYINDSTAGKMDYYLQYRTSLASVDCRQHGGQDLRASMSLTSTMPANFRPLGPYVLGSGQYSPLGTIAFNLRIYAPAGGEITGLRIDGAPHSITADLHKGRQVAFVPVTLKPGQESVVTADIRTANGQSGDGVLNFTPGMVSAPNGVKAVSACD